MAYLFAADGTATPALAQNAGASQAILLDVLSIAFLHSGPRGLNVAAIEVGDYLDGYLDPEPQH